MNEHRFRKRLLLCCLTLFAFQLQAQRPMGPSVSLEADYSGQSDLSRGVPNVGTLSSSRITLSSSWLSLARRSVSVGTTYRLRSFHHDGTAPLPDHLHAISVPVTLVKRWNKWTLISRANPGVFSDLEDLSWGDLNLPVMVSGDYSVSPSLDLLLGMRLDLRNEIPVVGGPGFRWRFADDWSLNVFFPKPELVWRFSDGLTFSAGGQFVGGSYRVGERFGRDRGEPFLDDTQLSYREIRATIGCTWRVSEKSSLVLSTGALINRRAAFDDRRLQLNGGPAPFGMVRWEFGF